MFHKKDKNDGIKASVTKFLSPQNPLAKRLKHLAVAIKGNLEKQNDQQTKEFFSQHYYIIYQVFHDAFIVETTGKAGKGGHGKAVKEELFELILPVLEAVLVYTPDLLYQKWQCNSIGTVLCRLLHPQNQLRIRKTGLQFLTLWLQSLRDNITPFAENLLAASVPEFPPKPVRTEDDALADRASGNWVFGPDHSVPVFPIVTDGPRPVEDSTMEMMESLLECLTSQTRRLIWDGGKKQCGFDVLFHLFKKHYLYVLFPNALRHRGPFTEKVVFEVESSALNFDYDVSGVVYDRVRERIINWLVQWISPNRGNLSIGIPMSLSTHSTSSLSSTSATSVVVGEPSKEHASWWVTRETEEQTRDGIAMLCGTLYFTQENVILLHEVMRKTFRLPFVYLSTMNTVILLIQDWLALDADKRPEFMLEKNRFSFLAKRHSEPKLNIPPPEDIAAGQLSPSTSMEGKSMTRRRYLTFGHKGDQSVTSSASTPTSPCQSADVRVGLQPNLRLFISEVALVFLADPEHQTMHEQVEACGQVIRLYQTVAMKSLMDQETWAHLLSTLLRITRHVLGTSRPAASDEGTSSQQLATRVGSDLVKTVFVLWMNASLSVSVSTTLWDDVLHLLTSLTHWPAVIEQWKHIMKMMTRLLGQYVYGVCLSQSSKAPTGRRKMHRPGAGNSPIDGKGALAAKAAAASAAAKQVRQAPHTSRHTRDHSISTSLEQFHGDPIVAKPAAAAVAAASPMPIVEEAGESGGGSGSDRPRSSSQQNTSTTASLRATRAATRRHQSEADTAAVAKVQAMPKLIGMQLPSVDMTSPLRDESFSKFPSGGGSGEHDLEEETEEEVGVESVESSVSLQGYTVAAGGPGKDGGGVDDVDGGDDDDALTVESSSEDGVSGGGSSCELDDRRSRVGGAGSGGGASDSTSDMTERLLQEGDDKSNVSGATADAEERRTPDSGAQTPVVKDSDAEDDLQPVARQRASTMNSLEAKQLFGAPGSVSMSDPLDEDEETRHLEVLAGGSRRGWTPTSAAVLWRRSLGILGDPNRIPDPLLHAKAISSLAELWEDLLRIRNRDGEPVESKALREETANYEPPLFVFAPWVFEACTLGMKYKEGQLRAYQLLCRMLLERYDHPLPVEFLSHAYRLLHIALKSSDKDIMDCVIWHASTIFAVNLPGVTILIMDFLSAAEKILTSNDSARPRREALVVLGSLLHYSYAFPQMKLHSIDSVPDVSTLDGLKDKLIQMLLHTTKKEPFRQSRCLALSMLGMFVYSEYLHVSRHRMLIIECINVLLLSIRFPDHSISTTALDTILLLTDVKHAMPEQLPLKIVEILCTTLPVIMNEKNMGVADIRKISIRILFCLLDWLMTIPAEKLNSFKFEGLPDVTLMQSVFLVLSNIAHGSSSEERSESTGSQTKLAAVPEQQSSAGSVRDAADGKPGTTVPKLCIHERVTPAVQLAAKTVISHLVNMLGHFPFSGGAASFSSSVLESHDVTDSADLNKKLFDSPCVQFFCYGGTSLLSLIELPADNAEEEGDVVRSTTVARVIVRDIAGKWCWDSSCLYGRALGRDAPYPGISNTGLREVDGSSERQHGGRLSAPLSHQQALSVRDSLIPGSVAALALRPTNGPPRWGQDDAADDLAELPEFDSFSVPDGDVLQELLHYITTTSPEVRASADGPVDGPVPADFMFTDTEEQYLVDVIDIEHSSEQTYLSTTVHGMESSPAEPCQMPAPMPFQNCRCLLTQLGFMNLDSDKRRDFNLLQKTDQLLRELRNLDSRHCRETHKIGIVYVHHGQQDKESILSNTAGSLAFEEFLSAMTWEVDLQQHPGFKGGLKPGTTGTGKSTAPYYASSTAEVLFHVATRMENSEEPGQLTKLRHIGNDEILIVWSEHSRDWRRDIIRTDFGDVMIVIYPMINSLYRIQILKKEAGREGKSVPFFGPLFDGAVVDKYTLPGLVRATAINASRARRSQLAYYQSYYEERNKYIQSATKSCLLKTTLEDFTSLVMRPGSPESLAGVAAAAASRTSRHPSGIPLSGSRETPRLTSPCAKDGLTIALSEESMSPGLSLPSAELREASRSGSSSQFNFLEASSTSSTLVASASLGDDVLTAVALNTPPPGEGAL